MKRKLTLVVCVIVALVMMFTLASCGGDDHSHTYDTTKWSSNQYGHWYAATCGCEGETSNYGAHVDADKNGVCDTCAYVTCEHTYETEWQSDENKHWNNSSCGCNVKGSYEDHVDENKDGICDTCDYVVCSHTYDDKWSSDGENHWHAATCECEVKKDVAAHVDAEKDGVCDVCEYVSCTHTYAKEWSSDGAYHWYAATCGCNVIDKKAEHVDANKDGVCEICNGTACAHTYAKEWSSDETGHWHVATCGCSIKGDFAAHNDDDKNGVCNTCEYVVCEHGYDDAWSSDETNHWHDFVCDCEIENETIEAHVDEDKNGNCDVCDYVVCAHTWGETIKSEGYHWNNPTCGCEVSNKAEHVDENADGACDVCAYESAVKDAIENLDSEASANTNSTESVKDKGATESYTESYTYVVLDDGRLSLFNEWGEETFVYITLTDGVPTMIDDVYGAGECVLSAVDGKDGVYAYVMGIYTYSITVNEDSNVVEIETAWSMEKNSYYKVYDNYIVVADAYGNVKYYSYYGTDGELLFVMTVDEYDNVSRENDAVEPEEIAYYKAVYYNVSASNHEDFIKGLYNLGVNGTEYGASYGFAGAENEGVYSFSYLYVEDGMYFVVEASFTVDAEANGISSANVSIKQYSESSITLNLATDTYAVVEDAEADGSETYEITQTFGAAMDSTEAPNPYPASDYIVDDYTITYNDETVNDGATIEVEAGDEVMFYFGAEVLDVIKYNKITLSATYGDGEELTDSWNAPAELSVNDYDDERPITFIANIADTFVVVIDVEGVTTTVNVKVNYKTPTSINAVVYDEFNDEKVKTSTWTMYMGQTLKVMSSVETGCNPAYTAALGKGAMAVLTDNGDGTYTFSPVMAGEFIIGFTSTVDPSVTTTLTVTVANPPQVSDILVGAYSGTSMYSSLDASVVFTPSAEGATNGTLVVTISGEAFSYETWEYETVSYSATYEYSYNEETEAIDLTYVSGDELMMFSIELSNYKLVLVNEGYPYDLEPKEEEPETPAGEATVGPIEVTMTGAHTYCYDYKFTFVAGEAGFYKFTVPAGFGVFSESEYKNYGQPYIDYNENINGYSFILELEAGEVVEMYFGCLEAGDYTIEFEYSATGFDKTEETYVMVNEAATPAEITVTVSTNGTITFTYVNPRTGMEASTIYEYEIVEGVMTLYFQGEAVQAEEAAVTLVDGAVSSIVFFGTEYTVQVEEDDDDEETMAITGDGSETNPFIITGAGSTMISASKWQPLFVQVKAGVTVTLSEGAKFYTDITDLESVVGSTVTPNVDRLYYVYADSMAGCTGMLTATVAGGNDDGDVITGNGTESDPFVLPSAGDYVCEFPGGYTPVWYVYTAEADGTLTVSSTYVYAWLGAAEDAMTANNTHNEGMGSKSISVTAGTTYYIMVGDWNEAAMDVPFTITVE